jgi:UDP-glucose 4-epimerase
MLNSPNETATGQRVLVAGASGFLGRHLVRRLAAAGAEVVALSRRTDEELRKHASRAIEADVSDLAAVKGIFADIRPQAVYQLCGHPDGGRDPQLILPILHSDIVTSVNLLLACLEHPVQRFVTTASLEESQDGTPPTSPYAAAKMASTGYARMFHLLYKVPVVILRPFMTYGPGQPEKKVIAYLVRSLLAGEAPRLGSGTRPVDWIYIDDVIDGFLAALSATGVDGSTFDLGSGQLIPLLEIGQQLMQITDARVAPQFGAIADRAFERVRTADMESARKHLGWAPKVSLHEGLARTVAWWRQRLAETRSKPQVQVC